MGRKGVCFLVLIALFLTVGTVLPQYVTITRTDSVKYNVFWEMEEQVPTLGSYVRLPLWDASVGCNPCSIVKRIGCMPGDTLTNNGAKFYCNGKFLGKAREDDRHQPFVFNGTVPPGQVFLVGDQEGSYDSRYFGFKPLADIEVVLRPLF